MEIRVIDDNIEFSESLCIHLKANHEIIAERINLFDKTDVSSLAESIKNILITDTILFINLNLIFENNKRQQHKGVELLTWLRIKGIMNHCVVYSFQTLDTIAKANTKNLLLFSKGVTFIRLPDDFSTLKLKGIKNELAEPENINLYLKSIFDITRFRHREANWWSVKVLWDIHRIATGGEFSDDYPQYINEKLSDLNNAVGVFLNELEVENVSKSIQDAFLSFVIKEKELEEQFKELQNLHKDSPVSFQFYHQELELTKEKLAAFNKTIEHLVGQSGYQDCIQERKKLQGDIDVALSEITNIETVRRNFETVKKEIDYHKSTLNNIYIKQRDKLFTNKDIPSFNREINILLIDDNAGNGWEQIFRRIFSKPESKDFKIKTIIPDKIYKDDISSLYEKQVRAELEILKKSGLPSLIILDLRLFDETDRSIDLENISGKRLLEKIRKEFRGIPVLISTASNKVWTFQELIKMGADAYWIKEGLDELREAKDSVQNYKRLLELVNKLTNDRYQRLKNFSDYAEEFEQNKNNHWCKNVKWLNGNLTSGNVDTISDTLDYSVSFLKSYLHNFYLEYGYREELNEAFVLSNLINKLGGVYENIHNVGPNLVPWNFYNDRGDNELTAIRNLRNEAAHMRWINLTWEDLKNCLKETKTYLSTKQGCETLQIKCAYISNNHLNIDFTDGTMYSELRQIRANGSIHETENIYVDVFKVGDDNKNLTEESRKLVIRLLTR